MNIPEVEVRSFKQGSEESFKEAWLRIDNSYDKTEPRMTLGLLLRSFYFGLVLRYRYALDTLVGGDFFQCGGDQAFNAIKKLIATYSSPSMLGGRPPVGSRWCLSLCVSRWCCRPSLASAKPHIVYSGRTFKEGSG